MLANKASRFCLRPASSTLLGSRWLSSPAVRFFSTKVFVQGIPVEWDEHDINARFSLVGPLYKVHFVKSAEGLKTGKLVLEHDDKSAAE